MHGVPDRHVGPGQVLPAPEGIFPYARQVFLVERYVHDLGGALTSAVAALGITALSAEQARPERLAGLARAHWGIEALHHIRDVTYDEDRSQLRNRINPSGPRRLTQPGDRHPTHHRPHQHRIQPPVDLT